MQFHRQDLTSLLRETESDVARLDPLSSDAVEFAGQLLDARPDLFGSIPEGEARDAAAVTLARCELRIIKEIPAIVEAMLSAIDRRTTEPAVRCALAGALAYLVKSRDLLPDDLPGGYGRVDDCMILRATISEFMEFLPAGFSDKDRERCLLEILAVAVPPMRIPEFQAEVEGIWLAFHSLLWLPEDDVREVTADMMQDPLGTPLPSPVRESIPLPPEPRLSMAPGEETIELREDGGLVLSLARSKKVVVGSDGDIVSLR